jgi:gluconolactonase
MPFRIVSLVTLLMLACPAVLAQETTVVPDVGGPEGPLYIDGNLYYVSWVGETLSRWDGHRVTVLNHTVGCGHNGLALTKQNTLLIACDAEHGAIIEVDMNGTQLRRWDVDSAGQKLDGGINDIVVTRNGGAYATLSGYFVDVPHELMGKVLFRAAGSDKWVPVASDLNYANGVAISPDQKTLYVNETVGNCMLKFTINPDGSLSHRSNFALLTMLVPDKVKSWWLGPDSMKVDTAGNIYVAQWSGGKVLKLSPDGKLLRTFEISAGTGTTNVALGPAEKDLYVTVVKDPDDKLAKGSIVRIRNN